MLTFLLGLELLTTVSIFFILTVFEYYAVTPHLQGRSALVYATQQGHHHVVKYLQEVMKQPVEERARFSAAVTGEFDAC